MKREDTFVNEGNRYYFDFKACTPDKGYAQVDSEKDAWYYGMWANPIELKIVSYCEGDISVQTAETPGEFADELRRINEWNVTQGYKPIGIDTLCRENITAKFNELGLTELLH